MSNLFNELKRRNVFKVAIAYLALGWVVIQVTESAVPAFAMPDYVNTVVFFLGLIGFPFALLFAWAFEMTPDGVKLTKGIEEAHSVAHQTGRKIDYIIIALLTFGLGYFVWESRFSETAPTSQEQGPPSASVAVLPFVNMSSDPEQDYFSDGISEEILNMLAQIPEMHVTSRSSAFAFKGTTTDIPTIANQLGVANVLEGSVRKSGNRIRITAQLIEAATDKHLWSETFDRELSDIFAIQDEISLAITDALKVKLMGQTITREAPTQNLEAYNLYLKGHELFLTRNLDSLHVAIKYFEEAVALDPTFAEAWAAIGASYALLPVYQADASYELFGPEIDRTLNKALSLDPDLAMAWAVKGFTHNGKFEWLEAEITLRRALKLNPNNETVLIWMGYFHTSTGHFERAVSYFQKAIDLAPITAINRGLLGRAKFMQGDIVGAKEQFNYALSHGWAAAGPDLALIAMREDKPLEAAERIKGFIHSYGEETDESLGLYVRALNNPVLREQAQEKLKLDLNTNRALQYLYGSLYLRDGERVVAGLKGSQNVQIYYIATLYLEEFRSMLQQQAVKDYFVQIGLINYWRTNGWPTFCRPLGEEDFECD